MHIEDGKTGITRTCQSHKLAAVPNMNDIKQTLSSITKYYNNEGGNGKFQS